MNKHERKFDQVFVPNGQFETLTGRPVGGMSEPLDLMVRFN